MNFRTLFPSDYVAASDLCRQDVTVVIASITQEEVGESKDLLPVLRFAGMKKGMVLNRTNAKRIAAMYGNDCDGWVGKPITLYESETEFRGETVPCIRVRPEQPKPSALAVPAPVAPPAPIAPPIAPPVAAVAGGVAF